MKHDTRFTIEKISKRLALIEPLVYRRRQRRDGRGDRRTRGLGQRAGRSPQGEAQDVAAEGRGRRGRGRGARRRSR